MKLLIVLFLFSLTASALDSDGKPSLSEQVTKDLDVLQGLLCSVSTTASASLQEKFAELRKVYVAKCDLARKVPASYSAPEERVSLPVYSAISPQSSCHHLEYWAAVAGPALAASYDGLAWLKTVAGYSSSSFLCSLKDSLQSNIERIWSDLGLNSTGYVSGGVLYDSGPDVRHMQRSAIGGVYNYLFDKHIDPNISLFCAQIVSQFAENKCFLGFNGSMLYDVVFDQIVVVNSNVLKSAYDRSVKLLKHVKDVTPEVMQLIEGLNKQLEVNNKVVSSFAPGRFNLLDEEDRPVIFDLLKVSQGMSAEGASGAFAALLQSMENPSNWERQFAAEIVKGLAADEKEECLSLWKLESLAS